MRRGLSPTKAKEEPSYRKERDEVRRSNPSVNYWKYFCHYNNAVYQGGMNAYKKHGKGLLLHDDGSAVVTEYMHDTICGHNIIFRENSIASLLYKNNTDCEIAYKVGKCIIKIPFSDSEKPHGLGLLIDYELYKVYELIFKKGVLVEKILHLDRRNNDDAFRNNNVAKLIGSKHEQAFSLNFEKPQTMQVRYNNNQLIIGYHDEHGEIKGLAFKMYAQNVDAWGKNGLYLKYIERGYYRHSLLQTFGQKYFSNGNKYIGEFLGGQFEGDGILLCPQEMKWMKGQFKDGKLTKVKDSNSKKYTQNNFHMWNKGLQEIHQKYRERYIDFDIQLPQQPFLYKILKQAVHMPVTEVEPDYQLSMKEDQYRMQRIQQQFLSGHPGDSNKSYVDEQLDKHYLVKANKSLRPFESQSIKNKYYEDQAPKINKTSKQVYFQQRREPSDRIQRNDKPNNMKLTESQYRDSEKHYQMKDPFQIQLIKVPYDEPEKQVKPRERAKLQQRQVKVTPKRQTYARQQSKQSSRQRKKSPTTNFDSNRPYERLYSSPYEGLYSRNYLAELQRQRDWYRRLEREDAQYFNYLRGGIERSPQHRSYYRTPPKYESYPSRYNGKIINKKALNTTRQVANQSQRYSPQRYSSQLYSSKESSLDKNRSIGASRTSPYKYRR